ncbi:hypothetical protein HDU96_008662 [Phlyctochytrium bullatum]|nr:hypothetical protein HDU96_008662 [Phlyctochytrium bullatum]
MPNTPKKDDGSAAADIRGKKAEAARTSSRNARSNLVMKNRLAVTNGPTPRKDDVAAGSAIDPPYAQKGEASSKALNLNGQGATPLLKKAVSNLSNTPKTPQGDFLYIRQYCNANRAAKTPGAVPKAVDPTAECQATEPFRHNTAYQLRFPRRCNDSS